MFKPENFNQRNSYNEIVDEVLDPFKKELFDLDQEIKKWQKPLEEQFVLEYGAGGGREKSSLKQEYNKKIKTTLDLARETGVRVAFNLEVPIYEGSTKTYYDKLKTDLNKLYKEYKDSNISPKEFDDLCTDARRKWTREMYRYMPGEGSSFFERRSAGGMKEFTKAINIKQGIGITPDRLEVLGENEAIYENIQNTLLTKIDINKIPKKRIIDGINVRKFLEKNNIKTCYSLIFAIAKKYNYKPETIFGILYQESQFNTFSTSNTYCAGLSQGSSFYHSKGWSKNKINPYNPIESIIRIGAFFDQQLLYKYQIIKRDNQKKKKYRKNKEAIWKGKNKNDVIASIFSSAGFGFYNHSYINAVKKGYKIFIGRIAKLDPTKVKNGKLLNNKNHLPMFASTNVSKTVHKNKVVNSKPNKASASIEKNNIQNKKEKREILSSKTEIYHIQSGDTFNKIAYRVAPIWNKREKMVKKLKRLNPNVNENNLKAGAELIIPAEIITVPSVPLIAIINKRYHGWNDKKAATRTLKALNGLDPDTGRIKPGDKILVPIV